jgi:hypothetical protein
VKGEFGPDASVISTSLVPARGWARLTGWRVVEITAALPAGLSEYRPALREIDETLDGECSAVRHAPDNRAAWLVAAGVERSRAVEVADAIACTARDLDAALAGARPPVLVDTARTSPQDAGRVFERYLPARPDRVMLTTTDETESLMRVLRPHRMPVSHLGTGQRVPGDLRPATAALLPATMLGDLSAAIEDQG